LSEKESRHNGRASPFAGRKLLVGDTSGPDCRRKGLTQLQDTKFVGLDVHKESITVAVAERDGEVRDWGTIVNNPEVVQKLVRQLGPREKLLVAYEAGPCGYGLYRQLWSMDVPCVVVAPSLVPRRPGDRVKTDRRDARGLARLLRSGELTPVWVPDEDHEALRDLVRAREDAKADQQRKRHQLGKFLLRSGHRPPAGVRAWTRRHRQWLEALALPRVAQQVVLREYMRALDEVTDRTRAAGPGDRFTGPGVPAGPRNQGPGSVPGHKFDHGGDDRGRTG